MGRQNIEGKDRKYVPFGRNLSIRIVLSELKNKKFISEEVSRLILKGLDDTGLYGPVLTRNEYQMFANKLEFLFSDTCVGCLYKQGVSMDPRKTMPTNIKVIRAYKNFRSSTLKHDRADVLEYIFLSIINSGKLKA